MLFTKSMSPVVAEEFGEATLEVEVSHETAEVQWMRQGVVIHPGSKFILKQNGKKRSLTIHKLTLSDRGTYSCETLHDRTQAKLTVERESAHAAFFLTVCCYKHFFMVMVPHYCLLRCCCLKQTESSDQE